MNFLCERRLLDIMSGKQDQSVADLPPVTDTVQITIADIPAFLHNSGFFEALDKGDTSSLVSVPRQCFKQDDHITSVNDFAQLLSVLKYWGLNAWPQSLLDYCSNTHISIWEDEFDAAFTGYWMDEMTLIKDYFLSPSTIEVAIQLGRREFVVHWKTLNPPNTAYAEDAIFTAAQFGDFPLMTELHKGGYPWGNDTCIIVAQKGDIGCLRYMLDNKCPWNDARACAAAAEYRHLEYLCELREKGCMWDTSTCFKAALNGYLNYLKFAHENGCPWDAATCTAAARYNHMNCLVYAHEHGCPWDDTLFSETAQVGEVHCLHYALENGCPMHKDAFSIAARYGHKHFIAVLVELGQSLQVDALKVVVERGDIDMVKYLFDIGCPYDVSVLVTAVRSFKRTALRCVQYLVEEQLLTVDKYTFTTALCYGNIRIVQYLVDVGCECVFASQDELNVGSDFNILKCIMYVAEHGWFVGSEELRTYVYNNDLPLCQGFFQSEGIPRPGL